jgi:hypothetical protein
MQTRTLKTLGSASRKSEALRAVCLLGGIMLWSGCEPSTTSDPPNTNRKAPTATSEARVSIEETGGVEVAEPPRTTSMKFADRTADSGISWVYRDDQEANRFTIVEMLGGGAGIRDFDRDGRLDVVATGGGRYASRELLVGRPIGFFRALTGWKFADCSAKAGLGASRCYSHGVIADDFDNDGFVDFVITGYGGLQLFHNLGDGQFEDVTADSGLDDSLWSSSAAWTDVNNDGILDLFVAHYVNWSPGNDPICPGPKPGTRDVCPPRRFEGLPDALYLGRGDGTFVNDSRHAGLLPDGKGLGVITADFDLDGDQDVYVANDTVKSFFYRNRGDGTFEDLSLMSGTGLSAEGTANGSMGIDVADFNLDGQLDLWVSNYERETFGLFKNIGNCFFEHASRTAGLTAIPTLYVGWGTVFYDFDLDGDEDVFVSNGHVIRHPNNAPTHQRPLIFENRSSRFVNVAELTGEYGASPHMGRGVAGGDFDGDGDADLVVSHINEPMVILENTVDANARQWLQVSLVGTRAVRDAVGATVIVVLSDGKRLLRHMKGGGSYASTGDRSLIFGIPGGSVVAAVECLWPGSALEKFDIRAINRTVQIVEGAGSLSFQAGVIRKQ